MRHIILDSPAPESTIESEALATYRYAEALTAHQRPMAPTTKASSESLRRTARDRFLTRVNMADTTYCAIRLPEKPKPPRYPRQNLNPVRRPALGSDFHPLNTPSPETP